MSDPLRILLEYENTFGHMSEEEISQVKDALLERNAMLWILETLEPQLDKLICYASTTKEYPVNEAIKRAAEIIKTNKETKT